MSDPAMTKPPTREDTARLEAEVDAACRPFQQLQEQMHRVIVGQQELLDGLLVGLLANGHLLIEGVPGLAKTTAISSLARGIRTGFKRIQFTPDLLPADLVGTLVYRPSDGDFVVKTGPIFSNLVLADEINRAPAKVQSALLEAMQERQVTIGDETHPLPEPFMVLATQNPIEQEGTYPLPEAQVDRFLMKLVVRYPDRGEERRILDRMAKTATDLEVEAVIEPADIVHARSLIDRIHVDDRIRDYVVDLVVAPKAAMLHGRVLDESGAAMASRELTLLINSSRGRLEGEEVVLDREGRFHLPYSPRDANFAPFRFQIRDEQDGDLPGLSQTLPMLAKEGVTDLGELQLGLLDQVAFGRVVNDLGEPIDDAHIQLQRERMRADSIWPQFKDEAFTDAHTDENGEFRLYGDMESARYRLRVRADEHFPEETRGIDRVTGSEIKLMRKARLVGSVKLPEWLESKRVKVELRSLDEPGRDRDDEIRDWRGKQYIYFDWARPGRYTLELRVREFPEPFLRIDDLLVRPGDHELHPRLTDLDLSSYLHRFEVFAVDEAGKRINPGSPLLARVMRSDGAAQYVGFSWKGGRAEIVNSAPTLAVSPVARGFRSEATVLSAGRSELRFLRVPKITLSLPGIRGIIGATKVWVGMRLLEAPELERLDGRGGRNTRGFERATTSYGRLGPNERTRVAPLMDGRYRVTAYLGDKAKGGLVELALGEVDVRVVPGGQPVLLEVVGDGPAVRSAMQDVLRRQAEAAAAPGASAGR